MVSMKEVKLTPQDILKKQFGTKLKGYDQDEVDAYLDKVISDYSTFAEIIKSLNAKVAELTAHGSAEPEVEVKAYQPSSQMPQASDDDLSTNMAIIQRISALERKVYHLEQKVNQQDRTFSAN